MGRRSHTNTSTQTLGAKSYPKRVMLLENGLLLLMLLLIAICNNANPVASFSFVPHRHQSYRSSKNTVARNRDKSRLEALRFDTEGTDNEVDDGNTHERRISRRMDDVFCFSSAVNNRRKFLSSGGLAITMTMWASNPLATAAKNPKSRTEGYEVQQSEREWAYILSGAQYNILRKGGTERQKSSILNTFTASDHVGTYVCAACPTALFSSTAKFSSGTGWPSFATALPGVEAEQMDPISATLGGKEIRCGTCGGHLGDLFNDGWVYLGTQAFETGNRYCIDGAALVFRPEGGGDDIFGDLPPPNKVINYEPAMFRDNSINSRSP